MPIKLQARMISLLILHQIKVKLQIKGRLSIAIKTIRTGFGNYLLGMKFKFFPNECQRKRRRENVWLGWYLQKMKIYIICDGVKGLIFHDVIALQCSILTYFLYYPGS